MKYEWLPIEDLIELSPTFDLIDYPSFSKKLSERLKAEVTIDTEPYKWTELDTTGLHIISLSLSLVDKEIYTFISHQDFDGLSKSLLKNSCPDSIKEEFFLYILLESLSVLKEFYKNLSVKVNEFKGIPNEPLCIKKVKLKVDDMTYIFGIVFPQSCYKAIQSHMPKNFNPKVLNSCELSLGVSLGTVSLTPKEIESLSEGDWIICNVNYSDNKGEGAVMIEGRKIANAAIDNGSFKIK